MKAIKEYREMLRLETIKENNEFRKEFIENDWDLYETKESNPEPKDDDSHEHEIIHLEEFEEELIDLTHVEDYKSFLSQKRLQSRAILRARLKQPFELSPFKPQNKSESCDINQSRQDLPCLVDTELDLYVERDEFGDTDPCTRCFVELAENVVEEAGEYFLLDQATQSLNADVVDEPDKKETSEKSTEEEEAEEINVEEITKSEDAN